jgi:hypothetical protein
VLNRAALILRPKQPYLDWAAGLDDSGIVPGVGGEQTVYLIPSYDDDQEAERVLRRIYAEVFERELHGWHTDEGACRRSERLRCFESGFGSKCTPSSRTSSPMQSWMMKSLMMGPNLALERTRRYAASGSVHVPSARRSA